MAFTSSNLSSEHKSHILCLLFEMSNNTLKHTLFAAVLTVAIIKLLLYSVCIQSKTQQWILWVRERTKRGKQWHWSSNKAQSIWYIEKTAVGNRKTSILKKCKIKMSNNNYFKRFHLLQVWRHQRCRSRNQCKHCQQIEQLAVMLKTMCVVVRSQTLLPILHVPWAFEWQKARLDCKANWSNDDAIMSME